MSKIINSDAGQFEAEVLKSSVPVLVDFWAPWCVPCQMMGPILDEVANDLGQKVKVVKVNVDEPGNGALAQQYRIMSIPSMKIFKGGAVVTEFVGMRAKQDLVEALEKSL